MSERYQRKYETWADASEDVEYQIGFALGLEEGKLPGYQIGLKLLLPQRFGPVPAGALTRIDLATLVELERWAGGILAANSLVALLAS